VKKPAPFAAKTGVQSKTRITKGNTFDERGEQGQSLPNEVKKQRLVVSAESVKAMKRINSDLEQIRICNNDDEQTD